jgi:hypothetical protein
MADAAVTDLGAARPATLLWRSDEAVVQPGDAQGETPGFHRLIESSGPGLHGMESALTGLTPGATTVLSFPARSIGARGILVELRTDGQHGSGFCDLVGGTAQRGDDMLDVGVDVQLDGRSRRWVAMGLEASAATLRLSLLDERLEPSYVGDGRSGAAIGEIELRETAHFLQREESPW